MAYEVNPSSDFMGERGLAKVRNMPVFARPCFIRVRQLDQWYHITKRQDRIWNDKEI